MVCPSPTVIYAFCRQLSCRGGGRSLSSGTCFAADNRCVDADDFNTVQLFNERLYLVLVGIGRDAECVLIAALCKLGGLFSDDGFNHYFHCVLRLLRIINKLYATFGHDDSVVIEKCIRVNIRSIHQVNVRHIT